MQRKKYLSWLNFALFVILGAVLLSSYSFHQSSSVLTGATIHFDSVHDAVWHLALMESINKGVPPANPLITGEKLVGYHYFNDLVWVIVHRLSGISLATLYLQVAPVVLAALFAASTLLLFLKVFSRKSIAYLGATLAVFGANFAYVVPLFFPQSLALQSVFWVDQTVHLGINQQLLLSLSVVNLIYLLFFTSYKKYWAVIAVLVGILVSIKVYATFLLLPVIFLLAIFQFVGQKKQQKEPQKTRRETQLMKTFFLSVCVALPLLLVIGNKNGFPFFWEPGWFFKTMFESGDRLNFPRWEMMRVNAVNKGNWLRQVVLWVGAGIIFFVGNFGVKIFGLLAVLQIFSQKKQKTNSAHLFWLFLVGVILGSFVMPTFFLQKGVVWNTIQFLPYAYVPLALFFTRLIEQNVRTQKWQISLLITAVIISLPTTLITVLMNLQQNPKTYTHFSATMINDMSALRYSYLDKELIIGSTINTYSMIPAFSGRSVYWADDIILTILANQHLERKEYIRQLELGQKNCTSQQVLVEFYKQKIYVFSCPLLVPPPPEMVPDLYQVQH